MSGKTVRDAIADWIHFEASIQNGFENSRGRSVNDHADDILSAIRSAGFAVVPVEPTEGMLKAGYGWPSGVPALDGRAWKALLKAAQEDSRE